MSLLEAPSVALLDKFKILWRAFDICKDAYFVEYMVRKQEAHEEDERPTPLLIVDKLLKFALDKYTDRSRTRQPCLGVIVQEGGGICLPRGRGDHYEGQP